MIRAMVVDDNPTLCSIIKDKMELSGVEVVALAYDGPSAVSQAKNLKPDVMVLDIVLPYMDGVAVLETLREEGLHSMRVFVLSGMNSPDLLRMLGGLDISGFFLKPYNVTSLVRRICTQMTPIQETPDVDSSEDLELRREVTQWLHRMAVPPHVTGYRYLLESICMVVKQPELLGAMTKVVYPMVAKRCQSTPYRVERNMRHAVEMAWNRCRVDEMERIFGNTLDVNKDKPNNSEFIAMLADHIRLERTSL